MNIEKKAILMLCSFCMTLLFAACNDDDDDQNYIGSQYEGFSEKIASPLTADLIYSKGTYLVRNAIMQSFDIDSEGMLYYDQGGGSLYQYLFIARSEPNQPIVDYMGVKYFGHGTNIAVEEDGDDRYVWINSNGTKSSDNSYGGSQTISRIRYVPGSTVEFYGGETYYLPQKSNIHPAIDQENDMLAVTTSGGGDPLRYFYIFRLSEARALPDEDVTLSNSVTYGGEEAEHPQSVTEVRTLKAKNLGKLTPLYEIRIAEGKTTEVYNYYDFQGFDVKDGLLYYYEGTGNDNTGTTASVGYVTVFDITKTIPVSSNLVMQKTKIESIANINDLTVFNITDTGYMEPEGIKFKNGELYLGFASKGSDETRRATIFRYPLN